MKGGRDYRRGGAGPEEENGMGWGGLVPTAAERREDEAEARRRAELTRLRGQVQALELHKAQLAAALRAIVDRDLSYFSGFVLDGLIPMSDITRAREVLRTTATRSTV